MRHLAIVFSLFLSALSLNAPAYASGATPENVALTKRYFAAIEMENMVKSMLDSMMPALLNQQRQKNPKITADHVSIVSEATTSAMMEVMPQYLEDCVQIYAEAFTEQELKEMVAFYESPTGRSITKKTPALAPKTVEAMMKMMPRLQASMEKKMCEKMDCGEKPAS